MSSPNVVTMTMSKQAVSRAAGMTMGDRAVATSAMVAKEVVPAAEAMMAQRTATPQAVVSQTAACRTTAHKRVPAKTANGANWAAARAGVRVDEAKSVATKAESHGLHPRTQAHKKFVDYMYSLFEFAISNSEQAVVMS